MILHVSKSNWVFKPISISKQDWWNLSELHFYWWKIKKDLLQWIVDMNVQGLRGDLGHTVVNVLLILYTLIYNLYFTILKPLTTWSYPVFCPYQSQMHRWNWDWLCDVSVHTGFPEAPLGSSTPECHRRCRRAFRVPAGQQSQSRSAGCEI